MLEYISYTLFFTVLILAVFYMYIKVKYGFWVIQPVFHIYDFGYMIRPPGIIQHSLPEKNKYTNFKNIETIIFNDLSSFQTQRFLHLIKENYLKNKDNIYIPKLDNIVPYFSNHNDKSFMSFYNEENHLIDSKSGNIVTDKKYIGVITSRPINIIINHSNKVDEDIINFCAYYVDYLCVDKQNRKKGIAPQLIQTHHYNQRHLNKNIVVSLFKREDELTGIVPLCVYSTYGFSVKKWTKPLDLSAEYKMIEVNPQNYHFLHDFIKENNNNFDIVINTELTNLIELIKTKNIFIYMIILDNKIISAYFFRKSCVQVEKNIEVLSCFASINNTDDNIFIQGFKISFWKIAAENGFGFAAIENISHNNILIENIKTKTIPAIVSPTAYFFYNFAYHTFQPNKVLIIN